MRGPDLEESMREGLDKGYERKTGITNKLDQ